MNATELHWTPWSGQDWTADPDQLVHVRFHDGQDDAHRPPSPASNLGMSGEPSNWRWTRRDHASVVAYAEAR